MQSQPQALPSGKIQLPAPESLEAPANAAGISIKLTAIDLVGNAALSPAELADAYQGLIGREATVAELYAAARAITDKYVAAGYAVSFAVIPKQTIENGHAEIDVVEGYVAEFRFEGDTGGLPSVLTGYARHIVSSKPLRTAALERFLLLANDVPGYTVKSVFDRIEGAPRGATRLVIHVEHKLATASVTIDNRGSRALGPWRADVGARLYNLVGLGEAIGVRGFFSLDGRELRYGSADLSLPLGDNGTRLVVAGSYSDAHPGLALLSLLDFMADGVTARIGIEHPLIRSRTENLKIDFFAAGQWLDSDFLTMPNSRDHVYTLSAGGTYWNYHDDGATMLALHLTQGLDLFGATTPSSPLRSRAAGSGVFTALNLGAMRLQNLGNGFEGALSASGQLASRGLLTSQECGYGGGQFGRGFDDSEFVGDICAIGSAELRYNVDLGGSLPIEALQLYGFGDTGFTDRRGTLLPGERRADTAYSAGIGIRWRFNDNLSGWVEYAQPFSRDVAQEGNRHGRVFFAITGGF